jgi:hypothetical protein
MVSDMMPLLTEFYAYTNAQITIYAETSPPDIDFSSVDVIISVNTPHSGYASKRLSQSMYAYFPADLTGMPALFVDWLPGIGSNINVTVSQDIEHIVGSFLADFELIYGSEVRISSSASPSFADGIDMIMTSDPAEADALAVGGIVKKVYMTQDGTLIYMLLRGDALDVSDPLTGWMSDNGPELRLTIFEPMFGNMTELLAEFSAYANVTVTTVRSASPPALDFRDTDVIISVNTPHSGFASKRLTSSMYAYFPTDLTGMPALFADWLPDLGSSINVTVSPDIEDAMGMLITEFTGLTGTGVQIRSPAVMSFADGADIIVSREPVPPGTLIGGTGSVANIVERMYLMPDGLTAVHVYCTNDSYATADPLIAWMFGNVFEVKITIASNRVLEMEYAFDLFRGYANVLFTITPYSGNIPVVFDGDVDIFITGPGTDSAYNMIAMDIPGGGPPIIVHYDDPQGMAMIFIEWLRAQAA